jgi:hypothetical protein
MRCVDIPEYVGCCGLFINLFCLEINSEWVLTSNDIYANNFVASAGATGSNFVLGITQDTSTGSISYLIQQPFP